MRNLAFTFLFLFFGLEAKAQLDIFGNSLSFSNESAKQVIFEQGVEPYILLSGKVGGADVSFALEGTPPFKTGESFEIKIPLTGFDGNHQLNLTHNGTVDKFTLSHHWLQARPKPMNLRIKEGDQIKVAHSTFTGSFPVDEWVKLQIEVFSEFMGTAVLTPVPNAISGTLAPFVLAVDGLVVYRDSKRHVKVFLNGSTVPIFNGNKEGRFFASASGDTIRLERMGSDGILEPLPVILLPRLKLIEQSANELTLRVEKGIDKVKVDGKIEALREGLLTIALPEDLAWRSQPHLIELLAGKAKLGRIYELTFNEEGKESEVRALASINKLGSSLNVGIGMKSESYTQPKLNPLQSISLSLAVEFLQPIFKKLKGVARGTANAVSVRTWGTRHLSRHLEVDLGARYTLLNDQVIRTDLELDYTYETCITTDRAYGYRYLLGPRLQAITVMPVSINSEVEVGLGLTVHNSDTKRIEFKNRSYDVKAMYRLIWDRQTLDNLGIGASYSVTQLTFSQGAVSNKHLGVFMELGF